MKQAGKPFEGQENGELNCSWPLGDDQACRTGKADTASSDPPKEIFMRWHSAKTSRLHPGQTNGF